MKKTGAAAAPAPAGLPLFAVEAGADERLIHLLWRSALLMRQRFDAALLPLGLRARHFTCLLALQRIGVMSQQALAQHTCIDPSTTVALLDELERNRLIERRRDPRDRRAHQLHLTALGRRRLSQALRRAEAVEQAMVAPLPVRDRRRLKTLLAALLRPAAGAPGDPTCRP